MQNTILINFYAGAGAGKTTSALELTAYLKYKGYTAEYVPEFAKDLVYANDLETLANQEYITGEQMKRIGFYRGHVDFVVTDSPALLGMVYGFVSPAFELQIKEFNNSFNQINLFVKRGKKKYIQSGRLENYSQALEKDNEILTLLLNNSVNFYFYKYNKKADLFKILATCEKYYLLCKNANIDSNLKLVFLEKDIITMSNITPCAKKNRRQIKISFLQDPIETILYENENNKYMDDKAILFYHAGACVLRGFIYLADGQNVSVMIDCDTYKVTFLGKTIPFPTEYVKYYSDDKEELINE